MIKFAKHNNREYVLVDSSFEVNRVTVPIHLQIDITELADHEKVLVYKTSATAFNRHIVFAKKKEEKVKKAWWKIW